MQAPREDVVNVNLVIGESGAAYVVCDQAFDKPVAHLEFNARRASLEFVMSDGEIRNFGVPVSRDISQSFMDQTLVTMILMADNEIEFHTDYPLVVHR